jgi:PAS domain S-box-containing protein
MGLIALALSLSATWAGAVGDVLTAEERAWLDRHGPLRYAPDPAFPPFEYFRDDGTLAGITPELLDIAASNLGFRITPVRCSSWSEVLEAVQAGGVDLIGTVTRTPERESYLLFTRPYLDVPYVLFVTKGTPPETTLEDLAQARVGVVRNYGAHAWLQAVHPEMQPVPVETTREGLLLVSLGQLDALLETLPVGARVIGDQSLFNLTFLPQVLFNTPQHLAVSTSQPQLVSILQKALNSISDAERGAVIARWAGYDRLKPGREFPRWARQTLLALLLGLAGLLVWVISLRRMVAVKTHALMKSENRYRTLLENLPQMIFLKDVNSIYLSCNERYAQLLHVSPVDLVGKTDADFFPAQLARQYRSEDEQVLRTRSVQEWDEAFEFDGKRMAIHSVRSPVMDERGEVYGVLGIFWDITERQRNEAARLELETQLRQALKMEAVGRLAGGMAHDFNNILTIILGNANLLADDSGLHPQGRIFLGAITTAAERAAGLIRQLLLFSRRQAIKLQPVHVNDVLERMRSILAPLVGEHISVDLDLDPGHPQVHGDVGLMEQVILNLALNARDAMSHGGRITMRTEVRTQGAVATEPSAGADANRYVVMEVCDTGVGMDADTKAHLFEPFFTTKDVGQGTGLGLASVYGIVQQHRGWIEVESEPGSGTCFRVFLPLASGVNVVPQKADVKPDIQRGTELILVVEDESSLRAVACEALQRLGYRVLEAGTGVEALEIWKTAGQDVQLVLTDIVMPGGITGIDLVRRLRAHTPGLRVIFSSGYSDEIVFKRVDLPKDAIFLPKPYDIRTLAASVRASLDR